MSSIADKLKKYLPAADDGAQMRVHAVSTLSLDNVETMQPPLQERTVAMPAVDAPGLQPEAFSAGAVLEEPAHDDAGVPAAGSPAAGAAGAAGAVAAVLRFNPARQQRVFAIALAAVVLLLLLVAGSAILRADRLAQQVASTGQSLMQSQRLAKSVSQALVGNAAAFAEVRDSAVDLTRRVQGLSNGDESLNLERVGSQYDAELARITPLVERAEKSA